MSNLEHRVRLALLEIDETLKNLDDLKHDRVNVDQVISQVKRTRIAIEHISEENV